MEEITLQVQRDEQSGWLVAWWDDPEGGGGITTQGQDLRDLQQAVVSLRWLSQASGSRGDPPGRGQVPAGRQ